MKIPDRGAVCLSVWRGGVDVGFLFFRHDRCGNKGHLRQIFFFKPNTTLIPDFEIPILWQKYYHPLKRYEFPTNLRSRLIWFFSN
jgi:hypothetical protein